MRARDGDEVGLVPHQYSEPLFTLFVGFGNLNYIFSIKIFNDYSTIFIVININLEISGHCVY